MNVLSGTWQSYDTPAGAAKRRPSYDGHHDDSAADDDDDDDVGDDDDDAADVNGDSKNMNKATFSPFPLSPLLFFIAIDPLAWLSACLAHRLT